MPFYAFVCPIHGEFTVRFSFKDRIPEWSLCPHVDEHDHGRCREAPCEYACMRSSPHVISAPGVVKVKRSWEEKANAARSTKRNMIEEQVKQTKLAEEAKERYGDERCAFED